VLGPKRIQVERIAGTYKERARGDAHNDSSGKKAPHQREHNRRVHTAVICQKYRRYWLISKLKQKVAHFAYQKAFL
jgi:hypothetical protein